MNTLSSEPKSAFELAVKLIRSLHAKQQEGIPMCPIFSGASETDLEFFKVAPEGTNPCGMKMFIFSKETQSFDEKEVTLFVKHGEETIRLDIVFTTTDALKAPDFDNPNFEGKTVAVIDDRRTVGLHILQALSCAGRSLEVFRHELNDIPDMGKELIRDFRADRNQYGIRGLPRSRKDLRQIRNHGHRKGRY